MTFCPDDQTNPSLRVVFLCGKISFSEGKEIKKAFKVLGQVGKTDHTCDILFCEWCLVFCIRGRLWWFLARASLSDDGNDENW